MLTKLIAGAIKPSQRLKLVITLERKSKAINEDIFFSWAGPWSETSTGERWWGVCYYLGVSAADGS